jgi:N-acetylneuraminate synthase
VDEAIKCGAEVIKHQTHIPDDEMSLEAKKIIPVHTKKNIYDIIKKCALNEKTN